MAGAVQRRGAERGFTILEVMIAAAILASAMALAMTTMNGALSIAHDNEVRLAAENQVQSALSFMIPEIRQTAGSATSSGITVASMGGSSGQLLSFKTCTGFDTTNKVALFSSTPINYWYDNTDPVVPGKIKRSTGTAPATPGAAGQVVAAGIDGNFQFQPVATAVTSSVTIVIQSTLALWDGSTTTVTGTSTVSFFN